MSEARKPWQGVVVALPTPFRADLAVDYDRLQQQVRWLSAAGCHGVSPCGAVGEYQTLTEQERTDVVRAVVEAAPAGCAVVVGIGGYGSRQSRDWAERAAETGADALLAPPPSGYPAPDPEVVAHYRAIAAVGLPVVVHNDPYDTRVDVTPELMATIAETDGIVAIQESSADVRRLHRLRALCPHLDVLVGTDDVVLESVICGARGWLGAFPNVLPDLSVRLYRLCVAGDLAGALALYTELHPLLGWHSRPEAVQAVKFGMELTGRYGGPCRPPRGPLPAASAERLRRVMSRVLVGDEVAVRSSFG